MKPFRTHGSGRFHTTDFAAIGEGCIFEEGVLVFHPENIRLGDNVYVGHRAMLKGYHRNKMVIDSNSWVGQDCFFHSAGGLHIGHTVGIGPGVKILTSTHNDPGAPHAIMKGPLEFGPVTIGDGSDIGVAAIILPGVTIGKGVQIGAGAVVDRDIPDFAVAAGVPARVLRLREEGK